MNLEDTRQAIITTLEALTPISARTHRDKFRYHAPSDETFGARSFRLVYQGGAPRLGEAAGPGTGSTIPEDALWNLEIAYGEGDESLWGRDKPQVTAALRGIPAGVGTTTYSHKIRNVVPISQGEVPAVAAQGESSKPFVWLTWLVEIYYNATVS